MISRVGRFATAVLLFCCALPAAAAISVRYQVNALGGNSYRYVYTITNDGSLGGNPVLLFDILFDTTLYQESSLQIVTPSNFNVLWSQQLLSSLPGVPSAYDVLSLSGGIPAGTSITGFAVQFTWLGSGLPGSQPFRIYNPTGFVLLQGGVTTFNPIGVPAASTVSMSLIGIGLAVAAALQTRRRLADTAG